MRDRDLRDEMGKDEESMPMEMNQCSRESAAAVVGRIIKATEAKLSGLRKLQKIAELINDDREAEEIFWGMVIKLR